MECQLPYEITQCYLPPNMIGQYFIYCAEGMEGSVDLLVLVIFINCENLLFLIFTLIMVYTLQDGPLSLV